MSADLDHILMRTAGHLWLQAEMWWTLASAQTLFFISESVSTSPPDAQFLYLRCGSQKNESPVPPYSVQLIRLSD